MHQTFPTSSDSDYGFYGVELSALGVRPKHVWAPEEESCDFLREGQEKILFVFCKGTR